LEAVDTTAAEESFISVIIWSYLKVRNLAGAINAWLIVGLTGAAEKGRRKFASEFKEVYGVLRTFNNK
jgi:hypothetical protein